MHHRRRIERHYDRQGALERGLPFDCFDRSDDIGGNWYFDNPNKVSSAYRLLHIDTSKSRMQFSDFPIPDEFPNYCHHTQVLAYFRSYAEHFGVRERVTFNTGVDQAERQADGTWRVRLSTGEERRVRRAVCLQWAPLGPALARAGFSGHFDGTAIHSHYYRDAEAFRGKNVLVLGMGNSAMDISVECSYVANKVFLSPRRGAHIVPKYLLGPAGRQMGHSVDAIVVVAPRVGTHVAAAGRADGRLRPAPPDHKLFEAIPACRA